jgi:hypothetical protein
VIDAVDAALLAAGGRRARHEFVLAVEENDWVELGVNAALHAPAS